MNNNNIIYRKLQQRLDKLPIGFPSTKTGEEIRILKHIYTLEEAEIAFHLSMLPETIDQIYPRLKKKYPSKKELEQKLDIMIKKGSLSPGKLSEDTGNLKYYCLGNYAVGLYELQGNRLTKEFVKDNLAYFEREFGKEIFSSGINQVRTVPVEQSISHENYVEPYDSLRLMIEEIQGPFAVAPCICRNEMDLLGNPCKKTNLRDNCLMWEGYAKHFVELNMGRYISKEEFLDILKDSEDAGLVIQPANTKKPGFICCCCGCCCVDLLTAKKYPRPADLYSSTYQAVIDQASCNGCKTCINRCQIDAIEMNDKHAKVNLNRCIGCGLCVTTCPTHAIQLTKRENVVEPPETPSLLYLDILTKRIGKFKVIIKGIRRKLGMKV